MSGSSVSNDTPHAESLLQSLEHLSENRMANGSPLRIITPVGPGEPISESRQIQTVTGNTSVDCLIAMLLGLPVAYQLSEWQDNTLTGIERRTCTGSEDLAARTFSVRSVRRFLRAESSLSACWSSCSVLRRFTALAPSANYLRLSRRRTVAYRISLGLAGVACLAAIASTANGIVGHRQVQRAETQRLQTDQSLSRVKDSARQLFESPTMLASSLSLSDQLALSERALAGSLLDAVATALVTVPHVSLDQLVWIRIEDDDVYESLSHALAGVPYRQRVESSLKKVDMQLEISGQVSGDKLEQQKARLDEFVDQLSRLENVVDINLLESPVDVALSSNHDFQAAGRYRVSVTLGGRP